MKQIYTTQPPSGKGSRWIWIILIFIGIVVFSVLREDETIHTDPQEEIPIFNETIHTDPQEEIPIFNETIHTDPQEEIPIFNELPMSLPVNGDKVSFHNKEEVAPLQIKTPVSSVEHYFIKVVDVLEENTVKTIFIRSGNTIDTKMPLGSYTIKYATGKTWYGTEHLFGPKTTYSKANKTFTFTREGNRYSGYTIELILQPHGNLRTQRMPKSEW